MNERPLKIGYFADGPWSHNAFERLVGDPSISFGFIVPRTDTQDQTLRNYAEKYDIPYLFPVKVNSPEFYEQAATYECDLFVSMSFNQIFRSAISNLPPLKTINCHAGLLPFYRGRNILNWALINDEKEYGITVHYIDEGIDTGDIILQRRFPVSDQDSYRTLLERAYEDCPVILYDAIKLFQRGEVTPVKQSTIHPVGFYCGRRGEGDEIINWDQNARDIFNFIRAIDDPGPRATTYLKSSVVKINKSRLVPNAPTYKSTVGQVLAKTPEGLLVKTRDSFIEILEITSDIPIRVGDKFKNE